MYAKSLRVLVLLLICVVFTACVPEKGISTVQPTTTYSAPTATTYPTPTPAPTDTIYPTLTPAPTDTIYPTSVPTPAAIISGLLPPLTSNIASTLGIKKLVFVDEKSRLMLWNEGELTELAQATYGTEVSISPDKEYVLFTESQRDGETIAVVRPGESKPEVLVDAETLSAFLLQKLEYADTIRNIQWIPGTHQVLFVTDSSTGFYGEPNNDLYRLDIDTKTLTRLLDPDQGGRIYYISPDCRSIVLTTPTALKIMDIDGKNLRTLMEFPAAAYGGVETVNLYPGILWSKDSQVLYTLIPRNLPGESYGTEFNDDLWKIHLDTAKREKIAAYDEDCVGSVSRDNRRLMVICDSKDDPSLHELRQTDMYQEAELPATYLPRNYDVIYLSPWSIDYATGLQEDTTYTLSFYEGNKGDLVRTFRFNGERRRYLDFRWLNPDVFAMVDNSNIQECNLLLCSISQGQCYLVHQLYSWEYWE